MVTEEGRAVRRVVRVWVWMAVCVALAAGGGRIVAATAGHPVEWVRWLGLAALLPGLVVVTAGVVVILRFLRTPV